MRFAQVPERLSTSSFVVWILGNARVESLSKHFGLTPWPPAACVSGGYMFHHFGRVSDTARAGWRLGAGGPPPSTHLPRSSFPTNPQLLATPLVKT